MIILKSIIIHRQLLFLLSFFEGVHDQLLQERSLTASPVQLGGHATGLRFPELMKKLMGSWNCYRRSSRTRINYIELRELMWIITILMTFVWNMVGFLMFCFPNFRKPSSLFFSEATYNLQQFVKLYLYKELKYLSCFPTWSLQNL